MVVIPIVRLIRTLRNAPKQVSAKNSSSHEKTEDYRYSTDNKLEIERVMEEIRQYYLDNSELTTTDSSKNLKEFVDGLIEFLQELIEELGKNLSDPEKIANAISEYIVQAPLPKIILLIWLAKRLSKKRQQDPRLELVRYFGDIVEKVETCLEIMEMQLLGLSNCVGVEKDKFEPILKWLFKSGFVSRNDRYYYALDTEWDASSLPKIKV